MPSPYSISRRADHFNRAERMVSPVGRMSLSALWRYCPPKSAFITGGYSDLRAAAVNSIIDRLADECALPVIVLAGRGSALDAALCHKLPQDIRLTRSSDYNYLYGLSAERMHTLLSDLVKDPTGEGQVSDWTWAFLRAVTTVNPLSISSMKLLANSPDHAIAAFAERSGIPDWSVQPLRTCAQAGHLVRNVLNDIAYKLPDSVCRSSNPFRDGLNIQFVAEDALTSGRAHVVVLNAAGDSSQALLNAVLAAEISQLLACEIPMAVVFDSVEMTNKEDPLLKLIPSLITSPYASVCLSTPTPAFVPGGSEMLSQFHTKLLFPYGDIGSIDALHAVLNTYGRYSHTDVNRSSGGRPIRAPFERHDQVATVYRDRPVLTPSDCKGMDAVFSGFTGGCSAFNILLIRQLLTENY